MINTKSQNIHDTACEQERGMEEKQRTQSRKSLTKGFGAAPQKNAAYTLRAMPHKALFAILAFALAGCTEPEPWPNSKRYDKTDTTIVYEAPEGAAENIEAAWSPSAVMPVSESLVIYASRGTRKLVELNLQTGNQRVLFDLASIEERFTSSDWASGLYRIRDWFIVATPQAKLVFCNRITGEIVPLGHIHPNDASLPADGLPLKNIDFALFGGIAPSPSGVYLAFGEQIFHATWDGVHPNALLETPLEHIAGTLEPRDHADPHDALSAELSLHSYTHFAHKDGWVLFWSKKLLKAVKDGVIINVTGYGSSSPTGALETFYPYALPYPPVLIEHQGSFYTPYWDDNPALLRIEISHIDPVTYEITGSLYDIYPNAGKLTSIASWRDMILSADISAGSFWQFIPGHLPTDEISSQRIFGPKSQESRFESIANDPESPYEPHALIAPQAIVTFHQGKYHLAYAPTLKRLHLLPAHMQNQTPIWEGSLTHMASDGHYRAWFRQTNALYFFELSERLSIELSYVPSFFRAAPVMGVPCPRTQCRLTASAQIEISGEDLLLYMPEAYRVMKYETAKDEATFLHESGWYHPSSSDPEFFLNGLMLSQTTAWKANSRMEAVIMHSEDIPYLAVVNLTSKNITVGGQRIPNLKGRVMAGSGDLSIADGVPLEQSRFEQLHALALTQDSGILVAANAGIFETSTKGTWKAWSQCSLETLPHAPENLEISGDAPNRVLFAHVGGQLYACAENPVTFLGIDISSDWKLLPYAYIKPCQNSAGLASFDQDTQKLCWHTSHEDVSPKCVPQPDDFEVSSLACTESDFYVSGQHETADQYSIMHASWTQFKALTDYLGTGTGLPDEGKISEITLGSNLGSMVTDGIPWLYFWMKDTCTIWKLPAFKSAEIDENTPVYRLLTDSRLCQAEAFAITQSGQMAVIHQKTLYEIDGQDFVPLATLNHDTIDMIGMGHGFVIMTTDGIYLWERGRLSKRASNPIAIDGKNIDYAKIGNVWPRMTQSPDQNAVLIPVFEGDRIIKIAL